LALSPIRGVGGVAYMAHIGGFVAGLLLVKPMTAGRRSAIGV
jgi:membrane associated rhomboid family serine protease